MDAFRDPCQLSTYFLSLTKLIYFSSFLPVGNHYYTHWVVKGNTRFYMTKNVYILTCQRLLFMYVLSFHFNIVKNLLIRSSYIFVFKVLLPMTTVWIRCVYIIEKAMHKTSSFREISWSSRLSCRHRTRVVQNLTCLSLNIRIQIISLIHVSVFVAQVVSVILTHHNHVIINLDREPKTQKTNTKGKKSSHPFTEFKNPLRNNVIIIIN